MESEQLETEGKASKWEQALQRLEITPEQHIKGSGSFNSPNPSTGFLLAMARTCTWVNRIRW
jgi:hypothetical protein